MQIAAKDYPDAGDTLTAHGHVINTGSLRREGNLS